MAGTHSISVAPAARNPSIRTRKGTQETQNGRDALRRVLNPTAATCVGRSASGGELPPRIVKTGGGSHGLGRGEARPCHFGFRDRRRQANPCVPSPMLAINFFTNFLLGPVESPKD